MKQYDDEKCLRIDIEQPEVLKSSSGKIIKTLSSTKISVIYNPDDISTSEVEKLIKNGKYVFNKDLMIISTEMAERLKKIMRSKPIED